MIISLVAAAAALPFHLHEQGRDIDFEYRWTSEASAIPKLRQRLTAELAHDRSSSAKLAARDRVESRENNYPFRQHSFSRRLLFGGASVRLASFADERTAFTGGAHPNPATIALLWDKISGRKVEFTGLFAQNPSAILRPGYCKRLGEQRKQKLGGERAPSKYWDACPDPLTLAVIPEDRNGNGRFETINVTASPTQSVLMRKAIIS